MREESLRAYRIGYDRSQDDGKDLPAEGGREGGRGSRATSQYPRPLWLLKRCDLGGSLAAAPTYKVKASSCAGARPGRVSAQGGGRRLNEVKDKR